jgi:hypothetical protein
LAFLRKFHHLISNINFVSHENIFSGYADGHSFEEETHLHDEPFGYEHGDDPFDPRGVGDYPWMIIFFSSIAIVHFTHSWFKFDRRKIGEVFYH